MGVLFKKNGRWGIVRWKAVVLSVLFAVYLIILTKGVATVDAKITFEDTPGCELTFAFWNTFAIENNTCYLEKVLNGMGSVVALVNGDDADHGSWGRPSMQFQLAIWLRWPSYQAAIPTRR